MWIRLPHHRPRGPLQSDPRTHDRVDRRVLGSSRFLRLGAWRGQGRGHRLHAHRWCELLRAVLAAPGKPPSFRKESRTPDLPRHHRGGDPLPSPGGRWSFRRRRALHGGKCVKHDRTRCDRMDRLSVGCAGPVARCGRHRSDGRISRKWATRHSSLAPVPVRSARDSAAARSQRGHARAPRRSHARRQGTRLTDRLSDRPLRPLRNRRVHARTHWR